MDCTGRPIGDAISMERRLEQEKKYVRTLLAHTTQNPPMASCIPDHYDDEARRDEDARNLQFELLAVRCGGSNMIELRSRILVDLYPSYN
jgi:hypothetical protein